MFFWEIKHRCIHVDEKTHPKLEHPKNV